MPRKQYFFENEVEGEKKLWMYVKWVPTSKRIIIIINGFYNS